MNHRVNYKSQKSEENLYHFSIDHDMDTYFLRKQQCNKKERTGCI